MPAAQPVIYAPRMLRGMPRLFAAYSSRYAHAAEVPSVPAAFAARLQARGQRYRAAMLPP